MLLIDPDVKEASETHLKQIEVFNVTKVTTAEAAVKKLKESNVNIELILLDSDVHDKGKDQLRKNIELLKELSKGPKHIPVIILTSVDDTEANQQFLDEGAKHVSIKPLQKHDRDNFLKQAKKFRRLQSLDDDGLSFASTASIYRSSDAQGTTLSSTNDQLGIFEKIGGQTKQSRSSLTESEAHLQPDEVESEVSDHAASLNSNAAAKSGALATHDAGVENVIKREDGSSADGSGLKSKRQEIHSAVGTLHFMAPEVIGARKYGIAVDWWAAGVTFYVCTVREHLFKGAEKKDILQRIYSGPIDVSLLRGRDKDLESLVRSLLVRDISLRLGTGGAGSIKQHKFFAGIDWDSISKAESPFKPPQRINDQRPNDSQKHLYYGINRVTRRESRFISGSLAVTMGTRLRMKSNGRMKKQKSPHWGRPSMGGWSNSRGGLSSSFKSGMLPAVEESSHVEESSEPSSSTVSKVTETVKAQSMSDIVRLSGVAIASAHGAGASITAGPSTGTGTACGKVTGGSGNVSQGSTVLQYPTALDHNFNAMDHTIETISLT